MDYGFYIFDFLNFFIMVIFGRDCVGEFLIFVKWNKNEKNNVNNKEEEERRNFISL